MEGRSSMRKTIHLTHGAMTIALTGVLLMMDRLFMGFFMPFLALPLIVYGINYSLKETALVAFANVLISIMLSGLLPAVLATIGYGFVGLAYVYAYQHNFTKKQYYIIMSIFMSIIYFVMVAFFGEYFGISVIDTVDTLANTYVGQRVGPNVVKTLAYSTIPLTMLMEVFIVKVSADLVIRLVGTRRKQ